MDQPRKEDDKYWLPTTIDDGVKSTPFNHVRYDMELEQYCSHIQSELIEMTEYRDGLAKLYIDTMNDLASEHVQKCEILDILQEVIDSTINNIPIPIKRKAMRILNKNTSN